MRAQELESLPGAIDDLIRGLAASAVCSLREAVARGFVGGIKSGLVDHFVERAEVNRLAALLEEHPVLFGPFGKHQPGTGGNFKCPAGLDVAVIPIEQAERDGIRLNGLAHLFAPQLMRTDTAR